MAIQKSIFWQWNVLQSVRREDAVITNVQSCHSCIIRKGHPLLFQVAMNLCMNRLPKCLYQKEADFLLTSRDI